MKEKQKIQLHYVIFSLTEAHVSWHEQGTESCESEAHFSRNSRFTINDERNHRIDQLIHPIPTTLRRQAAYVSTRPVLFLPMFHFITPQQNQLPTIYFHFGVAISHLKFTKVASFFEKAKAGNGGMRIKGEEKKSICSYKKITLLICLFNIVVALYSLRSLYASLHIYSGSVARNSKSCRSFKDVKKMFCLSVMSLFPLITQTKGQQKVYALW